MAAYLWGDAGQVTIGTVDLTCVLPISINATKERPPRVKVGCKSDPQIIEAEAPEGEIEITLTILDEPGTTSALKTMLVGSTAMTNVTISILPEGEGAGEPVQVWPLMTLTSKNVTGDGTWDSTDPVAGELTFVGTFDVEPAWAAQSA